MNTAMRMMRMTASSQYIMCKEDGRAHEYSNAHDENDSVQQRKEQVSQAGGQMGIFRDEF